MSVSKWKYTPACDGDYCVGDCDLCNKEPEDLSFSLTLHSPMTKEDWAKIEEIPIVQIPIDDIIRCKDCKWFSDFTDTLKILTNYDGQCKKYNRDVEMNLTDYCSYAERRESE